ncbi:hypothetical protein B0H14DRAFT_3152649 [Mycena olivaceomarginata]|nr:hypothetical protein B0H14DRAFT_3152649 [Mycena olivaceomarginata]
MGGAATLKAGRMPGGGGLGSGVSSGVSSSYTLNEEKMGKCAPLGKSSLSLPVPIVMDAPNFRGKGAAQSRLLGVGFPEKQLHGRSEGDSGTGVRLVRIGVPHSYPHQMTSPTTQAKYTPLQTLDLQALLNTFIFILCTPTFHSETQDIPDILLTPICWVKPGATAPNPISYNVTPQRTLYSHRYTPSTVIPAAGTCSALVRYSTTDPPTSRLFPTYPLRINLATTTRHAQHATTLSCSRFYTRYTSHSPLSALDFSVTIPSSPPYRPESRLLHDAFVCARVALPSYATPPALRYAAAPPMPPRPSHPSTPIHLHRSPYAALLPARCCIAVVLSSPPALRYAIRTALHRLPNATARPMLHSCLSDAVSLSSA